MKIYPLAILFLAISLPQVYTQPKIKADSTTLKAMEALAFLVGEWEGSGWIQMGPEKKYFTQTEHIEQKAGNTVIIIDGLGVDKESNEVIHEAFAVLSYDAANKKYLMRAFKADGNYIDVDATVSPDGTFVWGFSHPRAGEIKYTIKLVDGKWVEKGESRREDGHWFQFFETTLSKI